jgi:hypothetical protein
VICCVTPCNFYIVFLLAGPDTGIKEIKVSAINCYRIGVSPVKNKSCPNGGVGEGGAEFCCAKTNRFMFHLVILSVG